MSHKAPGTGDTESQHSTAIKQALSRVGTPLLKQSHYHPTSLTSDIPMRRATSGIATCLRVVSTPVPRARSCRAAWHNGRPCGVQPALFPSIQTDSMITCSGNVLSPTTSLGRSLSSKSSSGPSAESIKEPEVKDSSAQSSTDRSPTSTLASSDGVSQSLSGPRVSSKRGYLEREGMIRETQQAVRQYYKEGMYQVRRKVLVLVWLTCALPGSST